MDDVHPRSRGRDASPIPSPARESPSYPSRTTTVKQTRKRDLDEMRDPSASVSTSSSSLGQFSFAPTTRTTVVTTTTTTTTNFPPLVLNPPRSTRELDPKLYPLAANPTPSSLRNFSFELGGQSVIFNEPENTAAALHEVRGNE
jgi:F-box and WD-40 domain protein CDC4